MPGFLEFAFYFVILTKETFIKLQMEVNKGLRIINYGIDGLIVFIGATLISIPLFDYYIDIRLILAIVYFLYYFLFESITGRTPGKLLTKTKVVDRLNAKPKILRVLLRSLLRFNPFDWMSYLFGQEQGGHDQLSRTRLVKVK